MKLGLCFLLLWFPVFSLVSSYAAKPDSIDYQSANSTYNSDRQKQQEVERDLDRQRAQLGIPGQSHRAETNLMQESRNLLGRGDTKSLQAAAKKALDAHKLFQYKKDKGGEADASSLLGGIYLRLGEMQKALDYYEWALQLYRAVKADPHYVFQAQHQIAHIYATLERTQKEQEYDVLVNKQKALEYYNDILLRHRKTKDRLGEAVTLNKIGLAYSVLGERQKALEYYNQALILSRSEKNRGGEISLLNNIGTIYDVLGDKEQALGYYNQALLISRTEKKRGSEATALTNIGTVYSALGDKQRALEYYFQALPLFREYNNKNGEAMTLSNIGSVYIALSNKEKALEYYFQVLSLMRENKNRSGEATTLANIGAVYSILGEKRKAAECYLQSLPLSRAIGDRNSEATTLSNLMYMWKDQQQQSLAVYYGKQAVNRYQELRAAIIGLNQALQRSFLKSKEYTYRELADLLISLGRLPEAQQVLDLLKEEEYFNYVRRDNNEAAGLKGRAALTPTEDQLEKEYAEIADLITALGRELEQLNQLTQLEAPQLTRRTELDQKLLLATQRFQTFFRRLEKELGNTKESGERLTQIQTSEGFQDTLRELGASTVALYTVISEKKYSVILTPASGPQVAAEYNITREDLHKKIFALKDALKNPKADLRPLAAELYDILIAPIAKNLEGAKAETLMFSLDGALRYLPMAALYDKQRGEYLIEKYRVVMYTPAGASDLKNAARASWKGLGFGVSKEIRNAEVGNFRALTGVPGELSSVIRTSSNPKGVMEGKVFLDEQFTEQRFLDSLRPREYPLIHIASHFAFKPGDSLKSFLLLGDGHGLTLEKLREMNHPFSGVDLLALSACETGVGQKDEEGNEVEGFGVLAQKKGAKAVLATLWPVADESTAKLMSEFYRLREAQQGMNKAEALRQAQLQMLHGKVAIADATRTRDFVPLEEQNSKQPKFEADPSKPFAHPYYWAPFILIGNWK